MKRSDYGSCNFSLQMARQEDPWRSGFGNFAIIGKSKREFWLVRFFHIFRAVSTQFRARQKSNFLLGKEKILEAVASRIFVVEISGIEPLTS